MGEIVIAPMLENPTVLKLHFPTAFPVDAAISGEG
jgi:hypothetical protein